MKQRSAQPSPILPNTEPPSNKPRVSYLRLSHRLGGRVRPVEVALAGSKHQTTDPGRAATRRRPHLEAKRLPRSRYLRPTPPHRAPTRESKGRNARAALNGLWRRLGPLNASGSMASLAVTVSAPQIAHRFDAVVLPAAAVCPTLVCGTRSLASLHLRRLLRRYL